MKLIKEYPEFHQQGIISIENKDMILSRENDFTEMVHGDFGIQIARDGRVWVCINGMAFIRFKPEVKENGRKSKTRRTKAN